VCATFKSYSSTYQLSDSFLLDDQITNALGNILAVGLLYICNLICAHTTGGIYMWKEIF